MPSDDTQAQVDRVQAALRKLPQIMQPMIRNVFRKFGLAFRRVFVSKRLSGGSGLGRRSGQLARSFGSRVIETAGLIKLVVFTDSKYALIQEKGGTIVPKRSKYLAIPVGPAVSGKVAKFTSPRQVAGLQFMQNKAGNKFMGQVQGGKVVIFFVLKKSVTIKPRMKFGDTFEKQAPKIVPLLARGTDKVLAANYKRIN